jgi:hypothetical protein
MIWPTILKKKPQLETADEFKDVKEKTHLLEK